MIKKTVLIIGMFILVTGGLLITGCLPAQTELRFGTWASGNLRSRGEEHQYIIRPTQARLVVETNANIGTYVRIYDANHNFRGVDDGDGNLNARLEMFVQPGQTYYIGVAGFSAGPYQVRATQSTIQATELRLDTWVSGTIRETVSNWYRFRETGSNWYSVKTTRGGMLVVETRGTDTVVEVYNDSFNYITYGEYNGKDDNVRVELIVQPDTTYYIELNGYNAGPYQVRAYANPILAAELRLDSNVSDYMRQGESYWYRVRATQNGNMIVEIVGDIYTMLDLYDDSFKLLASVDNNGNRSNALIEFPAETGRSYFFKVRSYYTDVSGPFRVWASHWSLTPMVAESSITYLHLGTTVSENLQRGDEYWYSVRPTENGYVTVEIMSYINTYLEVYDLAYRLITQDDHSGGGRNSLVQIPVQAGETYLFKIRGYNSSISGQYSILANFSN